MADTKKRKERSGNSNEQRVPKRSKGGSGGKWQTPHSKARLARGNGQIEAGDMGIWATCAKNQESRAAEELRGMLEECAQRFYGFTTGVGEADDDEDSNNDDDDDEGSVEDIEKSIQREISKQKTSPKLFTYVQIDIPCVLFFKTRPPLDPVDLVHRICEEVREQPDIRRMRYVNRLTPMTLMAKATEKGLDELIKTILPDHFQLAAPESNGESRAESKEAEGSPIVPSYAIRPSIRAHQTLKRDAVIKQIASSISDVHKVDLTSPDKVILVEIYTTVCGISVVGDDWEALKRYNLAELYLKKPTKPAATSPAIVLQGGASTQSVTKDETSTEPS